MAIDDAAGLAALRADWNTLLDSACTVKRPGVGANGLSTGVYATVGTTVCHLMREGAGGSPFLNTLLAAITVKTPGQRTIRFAWGEDVREKDIVVIGTNTYELGVVDRDDPNRAGLTVSAELKKVPA
jgi:hypothetical protein